jgi:hypothetical protein
MTDRKSRNSGRNTSGKRIASFGLGGSFAMQATEVRAERVGRQLRVLALDVLVAVFPVVAGFGLYFLLTLCAV